MERNKLHIEYRELYLRTVYFIDNSIRYYDSNYVKWLEYELIKDFMKDKFSRSKHRAKKVFNKKIGGTYLGVD